MQIFDCLQEKRHTVRLVEADHGFIEAVQPCRHIAENLLILFVS